MSRPAGRVRVDVPPGPIARMFAAEDWPVPGEVALVPVGSGG
jgi:hypothetical protein